MRLFFFICLLAVFVLSGLSLFLGGHPGIEKDEFAVIIAMVLMLIAVVIMAWRGRVFKRKGHWVYSEDLHGR